MLGRLRNHCEGLGSRGKELTKERNGTRLEVQLSMLRPKGREDPGRSGATDILKQFLIKHLQRIGQTMHHLDQFSQIG